MSQDYTQFKVGDEVMFDTGAVYSGSWNEYFNLSGFVKGKAGDGDTLPIACYYSDSTGFKVVKGVIIKKSSKRPDIYGIRTSKGEFLVDDGGIRLLDKKQTHTFKVGDRVLSNQIGQKYTGTIASIDGDLLRVKRDDGIDDSIGGWRCKMTPNGWATANGAWDNKSLLVKVEETCCSATCGGGMTLGTTNVGECIERCREAFEKSDFAFGYTWEKKEQLTLTKKIMNKISKLLLPKEVKDFIKVGFMNEDLSLTSSGREQLDAILFEKFQKELHEKAVEIIEEFEKKSK